MGKFIVRPAKGGYRYNLVANNGEIIATCAARASRAGCLAAVEEVRRAAPDAPVEDQTAPGPAPLPRPKFEVYNDRAGEFRFRLVAPGGEIIAVSEGYKAKASCLRGVSSVRRNAPSPLVEP